MAEEQRHYHFPETLRMVAPRGTCAALDELADRRHIGSRSELMRQVLLREVEANGLKLDRVQA